MIPAKPPSFLTYDMRKALVCEKTWRKNVAATVIHTCKAVLQGINKHIDVNLWTPCPRFSEN